MEKGGFSITIVCPKDVEGIANGVDPDQAAPTEFV